MAAHQYIGNIAAALLTSLILSLSFHWLYALVLPAVLNISWGVVVMKHLPARPEDVQLETEESAARALAEQISGRRNNGDDDDVDDGSRLTTSPISFMAAMRIPNVLSYALAFGFLKVSLNIRSICIYFN